MVAKERNLTASSVSKIGDARRILLCEDALTHHGERMKVLCKFTIFPQTQNDTGDNKDT